MGQTDKSILSFAHMQDQTLNASGHVVTIPMQHGWRIKAFFEPVDPATLPLNWDELRLTIDEINKVGDDAFPRWLRHTTNAINLFGLMMFAASGFVMATKAFIGFVAGSFCCFLGGLLLWYSMLDIALSAIRAKLSELNLRFLVRKV